MALLEGTVINETISVVSGNKRSITIDVDFGSHTTTNIPFVESMGRVASSRPLTNIGLESDSSVNVLDTFSETMVNVLHRRRVKFFS